MSQEIMTQVKTEGQNPFENATKENDNSASSSEGEKTDNDQTGASVQDKQTDDQNKDGDVKDKGFADDPRWVERESDWKSRFNEQEQRHVNEIGELRKLVEGLTKSQTTPKDIPSKIPQWFQGDEETWGEYSNHTQQLIDTAVQKALGTLDQKSAAEQKAIDDATSYFRSEAESIEADKTLNPKGEKLDRNKLLKTALDNDLVDTKGRWNYRAAFKLMKPSEVFQAKVALDEKKKLANATTSENRSETKPSPFKTSNDFTKPGMRPW